MFGESIGTCLSHSSMPNNHQLAHQFSVFLKSKGITDISYDSCNGVYACMGVKGRCLISKI